MGGQCELAASKLTEEIVVEEVEVKGRLNKAANVYYPVVLVVSLVIRSVDPVKNVESSVHPQKQYVVACQVLDLAIPLKYYELWHDSQGFKID